MKKLLLFLLLSTSISFAQQFELTPSGFDPIEIERPNRTDEQMMEAIKNWAYSFKQGADISNVTKNSADIEVMKDNGFFYHNLGELFTHRIKYRMRVNFNAEIVRVQFDVREIYAKKTLLKMTTADFFTSDGLIKEDFDEAKTSLEKTANNALNSFIRFLPR